MTAAIAAALAGGALLGLLLARIRFRALVGALARADGDPTGSPGEVLERFRRRRDRAETALVGAESTYARVVAGIDQLDTGIFICDRHGNEVLRNRRASELAAARHGEALVARAVDDLLADARSGRPSACDIDLTQPHRTYQVTALPLTDDGAQGAVALVRDITEELRVDRIRREFVANVGHELKTPIGALALLCEALAVAAEPSVTESLIRRIQDEVQRVTRTIDDLIVLSCIEDDRRRPDDLLDLASVVTGAVERIAVAAELNDVTVVGPEPAPPAMVKGSPAQLESAVFNLLDNAVKYSEPHTAVALAITCDERTAAVTVQDHGIGIPRLEQDRIFERFYRVDSARNRRTGGTGLGLSIVRHVALNHGGEITVSSREGAGSTFTFALPVADPATDPEPRSGDHP